MADIGHNSDNVEEQATFFHHLNAVQAKTSQVEALKTQLKKLRREAKAAGIKLGDMDFALKCLKLEDDSIISEELQRRFNIARWLNMPVGHQTTIFDVDRRDGEEKAGHEGELAGYTAKGTETNPYKSGAQREAWMEGWHRGSKRLTAVTQQEIDEEEVTFHDDGSDNTGEPEEAVSDEPEEAAEAVS